MDRTALDRCVEFYDDLNKVIVNTVPFGGTTVPRSGEFVHLPGQATKAGTGAYRVIRVDYHFLPDGARGEIFPPAALGRITIHVERMS